MRPNKSTQEFSATTPPLPEDGMEMVCPDGQADCPLITPTASRI